MHGKFQSSETSEKKLLKKSMIYWDNPRIYIKLPQNLNGDPIGHGLLYYQT